MYTYTCSVVVAVTCNLCVELFVEYLLGAFPDTTCGYVQSEVKSTKSSCGVLSDSMAFLS